MLYGKTRVSCCVPPKLQAKGDEGDSYGRSLEQVDCALTSLFIGAPVFFP